MQKKNLENQCINKIKPHRTHIDMGACGENKNDVETGDFLLAKKKKKKSWQQQAVFRAYTFCYEEKGTQ